MSQDFAAVVSPETTVSDSDLPDLDEIATVNGKLVAPQDVAAEVARRNSRDEEFEKRGMKPPSGVIIADPAPMLVAGPETTGEEKASESTVRPVDRALGEREAPKLSIEALTTKRPILIDERDGSCEICAEHVAAKCDRCQQAYDSHLPGEMGGNGYQTIRPTHFHITQVSGVTGRAAKYFELCRSCYRLHWAHIYPEAECPIPESPLSVKA